MDQGPTRVLYHSFGAREASRLITTHSSISHLFLGGQPAASTSASDSTSDSDSDSYSYSFNPVSRQRRQRTTRPAPSFLHEGHRWLRLGAQKATARLEPLPALGVAEQTLCIKIAALASRQWWGPVWCALWKPTVPALWHCGTCTRPSRLPDCCRARPHPLGALPAPRTAWVLSTLCRTRSPRSVAKEGRT